MLRFKNKKFLSAGSDAGTGSSSSAGQDTQKPPEGGQEGKKPEDTDGAGKSADTKDNAGQAPDSKDGAENTGTASLASLDEIKSLINSTFEEEKKKAAMSEAERSSYELEQKAKNLDEREKEITMRELKANTIRLLAETGLPSNAADIVIGADMKETARNVKAFKECIDKEVQRQVSERLKGKAPGAGNIPTGKGDSVKSQFLRGLNGI